MGHGMKKTIAMRSIAAGLLVMTMAACARDTPPPPPPPALPFPIISAPVKPQELKPANTANVSRPRGGGGWMGVVTRGDTRPIGNAAPIFSDLKTELKVQTDRMQQVIDKDLAALNAELKRLGLEQISTTKKPIA